MAGPAPGGGEPGRTWSGPVAGGLLPRIRARAPGRGDRNRTPATPRHQPQRAVGEAPAAGYSAPLSERKGPLHSVTVVTLCNVPRGPDHRLERRRRPPRRGRLLLDYRAGITGRVDDVLDVSGHRMGTAEIERAL